MPDRKYCIGQRVIMGFSECNILEFRSSKKKWEYRVSGRFTNRWVKEWELQEVWKDGKN